jgi:ABC-type uncharacterized transport system substrate-binding protein
MVDSRAAGALLVGLALVTAITPAGGHPHVFVDHGVVLVVQGDGLRLELSWAFDELTSEMMLASFDTNRDRILSPAESTALGRQHFQHFGMYGFFVDLRVDGRPWKVPDISDFRAVVERDQVTCAFGASVPARLGAAGTIELRIDDPTYFIAFALRKQRAVTWKGDGRYALDCQVASDPRAQDFETIRCAYRRKAP